ncbi:hypothetical protein FE257_001221 [Aspergillus nanangensis]|uniref:Uncharacterized protein n=1 Tax=Aspergillus nanangensis TaxID=2582783 RepID=A0AAD4CE90_ASPNN|nr:hypothetical protein FE257_001221 [Aspergillus nanangensis]
MCYYVYHRYPVCGHIATYTLDTCLEYTNSLRQGSASHGCSQARSDHDVLSTEHPIPCLECRGHLHPESIWDNHPGNRVYAPIEGGDGYNPISFAHVYPLPPPQVVSDIRAEDNDVCMSGAPGAETGSVSDQGSSTSGAESGSVLFDILMDDADSLAGDTPFMSPISSPSFDPGRSLYGLSLQALRLDDPNEAASMRYCKSDTSSQTGHSEVNMANEDFLQDFSDEDDIDFYRRMAEGQYLSPVNGSYCGTDGGSSLAGLRSQGWTPELDEDMEDLAQRTFLQSPVCSMDCGSSLAGVRSQGWTPERDEDMEDLGQRTFLQSPVLGPIDSEGSCPWLYGRYDPEAAERAMDIAEARVAALEAQIVDMKDALSQKKLQEPVVKPVAQSFTGRFFAAVKGFFGVFQRGEGISMEKKKDRAASPIHSDVESLEDMDLDLDDYNDFDTDAIELELLLTESNLGSLECQMADMHHEFVRKMLTQVLDRVVFTQDLLERSPMTKYKR